MPFLYYCENFTSQRHYLHGQLMCQQNNGVLIFFVCWVLGMWAASSVRRSSQKAEGHQLLRYKLFHHASLQKQSQMESILIAFGRWRDGPIRWWFLMNIYLIIPGFHHWIKTLFNVCFLTWPLCACIRSISESGHLLFKASFQIWQNS